MIPERLASLVLEGPIPEIPPQTSFLVVDDIAINRRVLTLTLEQRGLLNVRSASSGIEAIQAVRTADPRFDVVFMDVNMPDVDGIEATRQIRSDAGPEAPGPVIIGITGDVSASTAEACLANGMSAVLTKPLNVPKMLQEVSQWIRARGTSSLKPGQGLQEMRLHYSLVRAASLPLLSGVYLLLSGCMECSNE